MWLCNRSLFLPVYISWRFGGKCRCGVRLLHRCSLHWVWVTALWSLTRPTTLCITTATGTPSWSQASTSWPQYWPLWLSLWSSVSEPRTLLWIVLQRKWESVFIFLLFCLKYNCIRSVTLIYESVMKRTRITVHHKVSNAHHSCIWTKSE